MNRDGGTYMLSHNFDPLGFAKKTSKIGGSTSEKILCLKYNSFVVDKEIEKIYCTHVLPLLLPYLQTLNLQALGVCKVLRSGESSNKFMQAIWHRTVLIINNYRHFITSFGSIENLKSLSIVEKKQIS